MDIKVKYFDPNMKRLVKMDKGDWIDLSVVNAFVCQNNEDEIKRVIKDREIDMWTPKHNRIYFCTDDVIVMRLGVAIEVPDDKKCDVVSRSSTFPSYGILLTNSVGCIDYVYNGDNDEWLAVYYCTRDGYITQYDRVCQFEVTNRMKCNIIDVASLGNADRGGHGTSGTDRKSVV